MLIQKENSDTPVVIKSYVPGKLSISGQNFTNPVQLTPTQVSLFNQCANFSELDCEKFITSLAKDTEVVIIGTGATHGFLSPQQTEQFYQRRIAIETMATRPACHTFQVLAHEKRKVCALLFV
ncbi:Mth938-like domain-containing protein [Aliikangiella sp. IMCC44653]